MTNLFSKVKAEHRANYTRFEFYNGEGILKGMVSFINDENVVGIINLKAFNKKPLCKIEIIDYLRTLYSEKEIVGFAGEDIAELLTQRGATFSEEDEFSLISFCKCRALSNLKKAV